MRKFNIQLILVALLCSVQSAFAEEWSYNFENFNTAINSAGARTAISATLNGLEWRMYGVTSKKENQGDYAIGDGSMRIYGIVNKAKEMTHFTLATKRDIGTFKFMFGANEQWVNHQVEWIVQWSTNGESWTTVGDPFRASNFAIEVERVINQPSALVRIVRADYTTYDFKSGTSYGFLAHIDNMSISDITAEPSVTLSASAGVLDFGEMALGATAEKTFTVNYAGGEGEPEITLDGQDKDAFTFTQQTDATAGTQTISVSCKAYRRGTHTAFLNIHYGGLETNVNLTAVGKRADDNQKFSGGEGTETNPYLISSDLDLLELSDDVEMKLNTYKGKFFKMTNNISMKDATNFRSIGNNFGRTADDENYIRPFSGTFDGAGFTISDLKISRIDNLFVGLFGIINDATIKNLTISKSKLNAKAGVAAVAGLMLNASVIEHCHTTADVEIICDNFYAAGICGGALNGKGGRISDCTNSATVTGNTGMTAGVIGYSGQEGFLIERCGNYGTITDKISFVGGIIAGTENTIHINDCFNAGEINMLNSQSANNTRGGGILGSAEKVDKGMIYINNCYNVGRFNTLAQSLHPIFDCTVFWEPGNYTLKNNYYSQEINNYQYDSEYVPEEHKVIAVSVAEMKTDAFIKKLNVWHNTWIFKDGVNNGFPVPEGKVASAINTTNATAKPVISIVNGKLVVSGNCTDIVVYDVNGKRVNADALFTKGLYIVKMTVDGKTFATKVMR